MILSIMRVMLFGLLRDRGAMAMAFLLPPVIYVIFAAIFAGAAGGDLRLRVVVLDEVNTFATARLAEAIRQEPALRASRQTPATRGELEQMVRLGEADAGVVLRSDLIQRAADAAAPIIVIGDAARALAPPIVAGHVQRLFSERLPDVAYRRTLGDIERNFVRLTPDQRARVEAGLVAIERAAAGGETIGSRPAAAGLVERSMVLSRAQAGAGAAVIYYAGAVGMLFLLFSSIQGAMTLIDERHSGITGRLLGGGGSAATIVLGKFLFLILQGVVQVALIFVVAGLAYRVAFWTRLPEWLAITVAASAAAAGFAMLLCALCRTRQQAQTLSNFLVLVLSAVGGSMVPRFLMPPWLQDASWLVPNAWAIEAFHALLWRDAPATELTAMVGALIGVALFTGALAHYMLAAEQRG